MSLLTHVQSLIAQGSEFPLKKPPGFHYDFFLLGVTTFIAALLGLPAPNGLIPQAPIHTKSLVVMGRPIKEDEETGEGKTVVEPAFMLQVPIAVVEQRLSNLAQGAMCLILLTGPFLHVLNLIPRGMIKLSLSFLSLPSLSSYLGVLAGLLYVYT